MSYAIIRSKQHSLHGVFHVLSRNFLLSATLLFVSMDSLSAQTAADADSSRMQILNRGMRAGWYVRATTSSGAQDEGAIVSVSDSTSVIGGATIHSTSLIMLERRVLDPRAGKRAAMVGGFAGLLLSGLRMMFCDCQKENSSRFVGAHIVVGAILGGLSAGMLTDSHKWKMVWPN